MTVTEISQRKGWIGRNPFIAYKEARLCLRCAFSFLPSFCQQKPSLCSLSLEVMAGVCFPTPPFWGKLHWQVPSDWQAPDQLGNGGEERITSLHPCPGDWEAPIEMSKARWQILENLFYPTPSIRRTAGHHMLVEDASSDHVISTFLVDSISQSWELV